ncbi:hypothetical protein [Thiothrix subterranea]|uniref:hypothetical protein n=1 Tax=Thiothrix subterranea TaxID=2735563 RepID=UPI00280ADF3B|nr:hypothetical protein [Thiothrix subterranea]
MQATLAITLGALLLPGIANSSSLSVAEGTPQQHEGFAIGGAFFQQPWVSSPASTTARDGLGRCSKPIAALLVMCSMGAGILR